MSNTAKQIFEDNLAYAESAELEIIGEESTPKPETPDAKSKNFVRILKSSSFGCQQKSVEMLVREILKLHEIDLPQIPHRSYGGVNSHQFEGVINTQTLIQSPVLVNVSIQDTGPAKIDAGSLILFTGSRLSTSRNLLLFGGVLSSGVMLPYELHSTTCRLANQAECEDYVNQRNEAGRPIVEARSWGGGVLPSQAAPIPDYDDFDVPM